MRLTLFEPDQTEGGGFLVIDEDGKSTTVRFRRHELEILKVLCEAFEQDHDLPSDVRGWRRIAHIAEVMSRERGYHYDKVTISRYLNRIRTSIRKATDKASIAWLEDNRSCGLRITFPITRTVLSQ